MAVTYVPIATTVVGAGGTTLVEFTSIPNTYQDLKLVVSARSQESAGRNYLVYRFNSTGGNIYQHNALVMYDANNVANFYANNHTYGDWFGIDAASATADVFGNGEMYICNYNGTLAGGKSSITDNVSETNLSSVILTTSAGLSTPTSVITSIQIYNGSVANSQNVGQTFAQYSTFTLYGIKNTI